MEGDVLSTPAGPDGPAHVFDGDVPSGEDAIVPVVERTPAGICLSCGDDLPEPLRRSASLRCHDCRDSGAPLDRDLVEPGAQSAPPARRRRLFPRAA